MSHPPATGLTVAGVTPLSSVDYPGGVLAAVVFLRGCPWRCPYCQNAALRDAGVRDPEDKTWAEVAGWLETRRGLLDAVVFTGGEPLLWPGLEQAARAARALGFKVGLHTSGMAPAALEHVLPLLDWVGLDLKAPREAYARVTGQDGSADAAWKGLGLLRRSPVKLEIRTTWHPSVLSEDELLDLARELSPLKSGEWVIQAFQPTGCEDESLSASGRAHMPAELLERMRSILPGFRVGVRE
ncbi:MAG: anaerobic ribonucleoside-triphosphate reductase activating protein [Desulfovibrio aminophilus]|uniref:anaerobic ribonucleoside-triphosphate reductase activating protein n=1 Tax=Desulfovibrio aminophilus TaxID=81425 RepID=UPI0039EAB080